jgi:phosphatidylserine/phosphatidylglycerophosphate/cardiolipin synthase-like enzyme
MDHRSRSGKYNKSVQIGSFHPFIHPDKASKHIHVPRFTNPDTSSQIDLPNPTTPHPPQPSNQQPPASRHESLPTTRTKSLPSALLHLNPALFQLLRHLRLDISLPNPYSRKLWQTTFATQLSTFVLAIDEGVRLRSLRVLISSWHYFREVCEWQTAVLVEGLGQMEVKGNVEVRGRGFGSEVVGMLREVGLGEMVTRRGQTTILIFSSEARQGCC